MDLSGGIFVALAVVWACYLIPKALRHHEELAANRPVDSFSGTMRVLERTPAMMQALLTAPTAAPTTAPTAGPSTAPTAEVTAPKQAKATAGRTAARRRRRVLGSLLLVTVAVAVTSYLGHVGWWAAAGAGVLVLGWLVLCRWMVRRTRSTRRTTVSVVQENPVGSPLSVPAPDDRATTVAEASPLGAAAIDFDDDGALWDPLPLTLPTYVSKPAARRTVRTIDLTQTGVTSSGHSAEDSKLAQQGAAPTAAPDGVAETEQRRAAGA